MNQKILIVIVILIVLGGLYWMYNQTAKESLLAPNNEVSSTGENQPIAVANSSAGKHLTDPDGMTLYVNIKDEGQTGTIKTSCDAECEKTWIPYLFDAGQGSLSTTTDQILSKLNIFERSDGKMQYALGTKPLYRSAKDTSPGHMNGDVSGDWVIAAPQN